MIMKHKERFYHSRGMWRRAREGRYWYRCDNIGITKAMEVEFIHEIVRPHLYERPTCVSKRGAL